MLLAHSTIIVPALEVWAFKPLVIYFVAEQLTLYCATYAQLRPFVLRFLIFGLGLQLLFPSPFRDWQIIIDASISVSLLLMACEISRPLPLPNGRRTWEICIQALHLTIVLSSILRSPHSHALQDLLHPGLLRNNEFWLLLVLQFPRTLVGFFHGFVFGVSIRNEVKVSILSATGEFPPDMTPAGASSPGTMKWVYDIHEIALALLVLLATGTLLFVVLYLVFRI